MRRNFINKRYLINEKIRLAEVRLIDSDGAQVGVVSSEQARSLAKERGLDLVLISEAANPPVCKVIDYGQFMYQQKKKDKLNKKSSQVVKEIKMSPKISAHDYQVRLNRGLDFLKKKYKIKLTIFFRGREIVHQDLGRTLIKRFLDDISEFGVAESNSSQAGKQIITNINPK